MMKRKIIPPNLTVFAVSWIVFATVICEGTRTDWFETTFRGTNWLQIALIMIPVCLWSCRFCLLDQEGITMIRPLISLKRMRWRYTEQIILYKGKEGFAVFGLIPKGVERFEPGVDNLDSYLEQYEREFIRVDVPCKKKEYYKKVFQEFYGEVQEV